jgi:deoxyribose-phosphate aldolase
MRYTYDELAGMIDHSLLHPTMTDKELRQGCLVAKRYKVASVCIKPYAVAMAARLLRGSGVAVGAVVGFPHGSSTTEVKRFETERACRDGATEIDVVLNVGKALSGDWAYVERDVKAVVREAHRRGAIVKAILENDFLPDDRIKRKLCRICEKAGADFVKTSTGYGFVKGADGTYSYQGATEADLRLMRGAVSAKVQVKAAGGVRDLDALMHVRDLGTTRCGATATAAILDEYRRRAAAEAAAGSAPGATTETPVSARARTRRRAASSLGSGGY